MDEWGREGQGPQGCPELNSIRDLLPAEGLSYVQ